MVSSHLIFSSKQLIFEPNSWLLLLHLQSMQQLGTWPRGYRWERTDTWTCRKTMKLKKLKLLLQVICFPTTHHKFGGWSIVCIQLKKFRPVLLNNDVKICSDYSSLIRCFVLWSAPAPPPNMGPPMAGSMGRGHPHDGRPGLNNGHSEQIPKHSVRQISQRVHLIQCPVIKKTFFFCFLIHNLDFCSIFRLSISKWTIWACTTKDRRGP